VTVDVDVRYFWHEAPVPAELQITQVYGWLLCPFSARVLVQDDDGVFNLPGGTPEAWDEGSIEATLVREAFEENQVVVTEAAYLGYQEVHRPGKSPYAQVRMAGLIASFEQRRPDPDGGRIYRRLMTSLAEAPGVLGWGEPAVAQAKAAARLAEKVWGLPIGSPAPAGYAD
jgi:8-oxo-dGTP diphosphatase